MHRKPFLIIGLPRSRTAWLSVFFTHGNSRCFHEELRNWPDVTAMVNQFEESSLTFGDSDCGLCLRPAEVFAVAERVNIGIVIRDPRDCLVSYQKFLAGRSFDPEAILQKCRNGLQEIIDGVKAQVISYEQLDDPLFVEDFHQFLLPHETFSLSWYNQLKTLRVTQIIERVE